MINSHIIFLHSIITTEFTPFPPRVSTPFHPPTLRGKPRSRITKPIKISISRSQSAANQGKFAQSRQRDASGCKFIGSKRFEFRGPEEEDPRESRIYSLSSQTPNEISIGNFQQDSRCASRSTVDLHITQPGQYFAERARHLSAILGRYSDGTKRSFKNLAEKDAFQS